MVQRTIFARNKYARAEKYGVLRFYSDLTNRSCAREVENFAIGVVKGSIFHSDTKFARVACGTDVGATWKPQLLKRFS